MEQPTIYHTESHPLPSTWNELTKAQVLEVARIMQSTDTQVRKVERLCALLHQVKAKQQLVIDWEDAKAITAFLTEDIQLTENKLPKIGNWYGPADRLKNCKFAEFISADTVYMQYVQTNEPKLLDKLVAMLYRRKKKGYRPNSPTANGDIREEFNSHTVEYRVKKIAKLDPMYKMAVLFFFAGCKAHFAGRFPQVFKKGKKSSTSSTWLHTVHQFTENITQYQPVLDSLASMVLFDLNESQLDAIERKRQLENS